MSWSPIEGTRKEMAAILKRGGRRGAGAGHRPRLRGALDGHHGLLEKAVGAKASMLQDVEARRRTEIEVINGAIVEAGRRTGVPTPHNEAMVWMIEAAEKQYLEGRTGSRSRWRRGSKPGTSPRTFPDVRALDGVSMTVEAGEIRALLGENGAGKSTLGKIVAGVYHAKPGSVFVDGRELGEIDEKAAGDLGIGIVHQEGSLVSQLSVAENIFAGRQPTRWFGQVDVKRDARAAPRR